MNGMIIVLAGPSGAGKGKTFEEISKRRDNVRKVLYVTSRPRRHEDIEKNNYIFVTEKQFKSMISQDKFFEYVCYDDNFYGTLNIPIEELQQRDLFFDKDVRGAISIKKTYPQAITIYIMPKDVETLIKRRGDRGKARQQIAKDEIALAKQLDFLVINEDIQETVRQIENIIECVRLNGMNNKSNIEFLDNFY